MGLCKFCFIVSLLMVISFGCASTPLKFSNLKPEVYEVLGEGEGTATGIMLFHFIPIGQNARFVDAYRAAVNSKGGDGLIDIEISEQWFWAYISTGYQTTVKGTVVKGK